MVIVSSAGDGCGVGSTVGMGVEVGAGSNVNIGVSSDTDGDDKVSCVEHPMNKLTNNTKIIKKAMKRVGKFNFFILMFLFHTKN